MATLTATPSFSGLLIFFAVAFAAPFVLGLFPRVKLPSVVVEVAAGKPGSTNRRRRRNRWTQVDATLVTSHSDKQGAAGTFKGGFGFHPLLAYGDETGAALAGELRPGNAGANTAADQIQVAEQAIEQIPETHIETIKRRRRRRPHKLAHFSPGATGPVPGGLDIRPRPLAMPARRVVGARSGPTSHIAPADPRSLLLVRPSAYTRQSSSISNPQSDDAQSNAQGVI